MGEEGPICRLFWRSQGQGLAHKGKRRTREGPPLPALSSLGGWRRDRRAADFVGIRCHINEPSATQEGYGIGFQPGLAVGGLSGGFAAGVTRRRSEARKCNGGLRFAHPLCAAISFWLMADDLIALPAMRATGA